MIVLFREKLHSPNNGKELKIFLGVVVYLIVSWLSVYETTKPAVCLYFGVCQRLTKNIMNVFH